MSAGMPFLYFPRLYKDHKKVVNRSKDFAHNKDLQLIFEVDLRTIMKKSLIGQLAIITTFWALSFQACAAQPLLNPSELQAQANDSVVRIIDIRDPKTYATNHIAGSVNAPYAKWRGAANNPGELPEIKKLTALVQGLGLTPDTHAVIVSSGANDTDFGASARVYWTLKVLGLQHLSILNGGVKARQQAGLKLDNNPVAVAPSQFVPAVNTSYLMTRSELAQEIKSNKAVLVDARPTEFFKGDTRHAAAKLPGTLEGAVNVAHSSWFKPGTSQMVSATDAKSVAAKYNLEQPDQEIVSFCNTGHWAATNWFVLSELVGDKNVKLYAGSMVDWTQAPEALPMQNVPNRFKQIYIDAKIWFANL
jgi:thiosulfate/3-mercaptopyruvate sulfurtransferase